MPDTADGADGRTRRAQYLSKILTGVASRFVPAAFPYSAITTFGDHYRNQPIGEADVRTGLRYMRTEFWANAFRILKIRHWRQHAKSYQ